MANDNDIDPSLPDFTTGAASSSQKKSAGKIVIIAATCFVGLISLCFVSALAYKTFTGKTAGSANPEGVITNALDALQARDAAGALRQADPYEVGPLLENLDTFALHFKEDGKYRDEDKPLEAYSFDVKDLETKTVEYSDSVARVELIDGIITQTVDKSKLPRDERDNVKTKEEFNIADVNQKWVQGPPKEYSFGYTFDEGEYDRRNLESQHIFYIAVKRDDRWYASTLYTGAEYLRILGNAYGGDYERPSFKESERVGDGSNSPEAATKNFIEKLIGLDTEKLIETTAPDRFSVGHDFKKLLVQADERNTENEYWKAAHGAVTVTDLKTEKTSKADGRDFVAIKFIDVKLKFALDVPEEEKSRYSFIPYSASVNASWNGKCVAYKGSIRNYSETAEYFPTVTFPLTDAEGEVYEESDFDSSYPDTYDLVFPVKDSASHIYPTSYSLTDYTVYHPVPWKDSTGKVVYDAAGNDTSASDEDFWDEYLTDNDFNYPHTDANGVIVINKDGEDIDTDVKATYESDRTNLSEKNCFSKRDLRSMPDFGVVTIKEKDEYYVSPIDTFWHYAIWAIDNDS